MIPERTPEESARPRLYPKRPLPLKGDLDAAPIGATKVRLQKDKDTLETSEMSASQNILDLDCDKPNLSQPKQELVTGQNLQEAIKVLQTNPWFAPSFLASFVNAMNKLLEQQRLTRLQESQGEIASRVRLLEMSKTSATLAKEMANNQARDHYLQAVSSFATAAVSIGSALQNVKNLGTATKKVQEEIDTQNKAVDAAAKAVGGSGVGEDVEKIKEIRLAKKDHPDIKKQEDKLAEMKMTKSDSIRRELVNADSLNQQLTDASKQVITGVTQVLLGMNKTDLGVLEEMQKINDGLMQALNKFNESLGRSRDNASADYSKFLEFINRIVESDFRAHSLSGRA